MTLIQKLDLSKAQRDEANSPKAKRQAKADHEAKQATYQAGVSTRSLCGVNSAVFA